MTTPRRSDPRNALERRALVDRMRSMYRELEQLTGAPIGLHRALVCIGNEPGLPPSRLALRLGMQRPAVSQLLKSLTMRGWIERQRSEVDQRATQIHRALADAIARDDDFARSFPQVFVRESEIALFLDVDGTLPELAATPDRAHVPGALGENPTDEAGFKAVYEMGGHPIRVGDCSETAARSSFRNVPTVITWLRDRNLNR